MKLYPSKGTQSGAALITSLVILLVLTVLGISAMQTSNLQENIVGNLKNHVLALQAAESALTAAETNLQAVYPAPTASTNKITLGSIHFGPILARGLITTPLSTSAYDFTNVWTAGNSTVYGASLNGLYADPSYLIEMEQFVPNNLDPETRAKRQGRFYYRVTARGVGNSQHSAVLLQEYYAKQNY